MKLTPEMIERLRDASRRGQKLTIDQISRPQPAPGAAEKPGPLKVPGDRLLKVLGYRSVELDSGRAPIIADKALG